MIILATIAMVLFFFLGRLSVNDKTVVETKEVVKYEPSAFVIRDTVTKDRLIPVETFVRDTVYKYLSQNVDTSAIIHDYFLSRKYELDFSSDSTGVFLVNAEVNQNKLISANSQIQPVIKTVYRESTNTTYKVPAVQFYGTIGTNLALDVNKISFGVDLKQKYLIEISGIRHKNDYSYTFGFGVKF